MTMHKFHTATTGASIWSVHRSARLILAAALLAVVLTAVGPPGDAPDLLNTMDLDTRRSFDGLIPSKKGIVMEAWTQIKSQAPREHWDSDIEWIVRLLAKDESRSKQTVQHGRSTPVAWDLKAVLKMRLGHTSALTIDRDGNEGLSVRVTVFRGGIGLPVSSSRSCEDCRVVYTSVSQPDRGNPGYYVARGDHSGSNPQGRKTTYDEMWIRVE